MSRFRGFSFGAATLVSTFGAIETGFAAGCEEVKVSSAKDSGLTATSVVTSE